MVHHESVVWILNGSRPLLLQSGKTGAPVPRNLAASAIGWRDLAHGCLWFMTNMGLRCEKLSGCNIQWCWWVKNRAWELEDFFICCNRVLLDTTELRAWSEIRLRTGVFMKEMVLNFWDSSEGSFLCSVAQRRCTTESNACSSGQSQQRDKRSSMFWERLDQRLKASTGCLRALWWETWSKIFAFQRVISSCCIFEIFLRRWGNGFNFILAPSMWCSFGMLSINTLSARVFTEIWRG